MSSKSFIGVIEQMDSNVWHFHIKVPKEISKHFLENNVKRFICSLNDKIEFNCALMPVGQGQYFININKELRKNLNLTLGAKVNAVLLEDKSKYGMPVPEEMSVLLEQDIEAEKYFEALTPGKQRSLLHVIGKPKSSDIRLKKALVVCEYLKSTDGHLDFKELNKAFKEANDSGF